MTIQSDPTSPVTPGSDVTINCTVELGPVVMTSELSLLMVDAQLSRDGITLNLSSLTISGTTFTFTIVVRLFGRNDSGNYSCAASVKPNSSYLTENMTLISGSMNILIGKLYIQTHIII